MDRRTKKDLERLKNITRTQRDMLGNLYDDMFGSGGNRRKEQEKPSPFDEDVPSAAELLDLAKGRTGTGKKTENPQDALDEARKALLEAQELMDKTDSVTKALLNNKPDLPGTGSEAPKGQGMPVAQSTGGPTAPAAQPEKPAEPEKDPREELDSLIGLSKIKHDVRELTDFVRIQKMRKEAGLKSVPVSLHLVFTGNPGTGKTTVARIISRLYKEIGVLSKGQLVEVDRSGLVAGYVGQTALKTQEQISKAMGGVLFIDEAYALSQKDDAFGQEAIDTILKAMEDHRDDLVVIVAGYTEPMRRFIESNPGLKSRFNKYIEFPDYSIDELVGIFEMNCKKYDYIMDEDTKRQVRALIVARKLAQRENYANARDVRNMFEDIITNQARRVALMEAPTQKDMMEITIMDLSEDAGDHTDTKTEEKREEERREEERKEEESKEKETKEELNSEESGAERSGPEDSVTDAEPQDAPAETEKQEDGPDGND